MHPVRGFAILLSLLLVLVLTIFAYWMLLLAENHYAATRMLFDSENARIASEAVATQLVMQHNTTAPGFFADPARWTGLEMKQFLWNDYEINGTLEAPWNPIGINLLRLQAERKRSFARMELPVRQLRFEDFALFSDVTQTLTTSTLFDGSVFVRDGLTIEQPVRFREAVHNEVSPSYFASYRRKNGLPLQFPDLSAPAWPAGLSITGSATPFWQSDHYELDLDRLEFSRSNDLWQVKYQGIVIGQVSALVLAFDADVHVSQTFREIARLPSGKPSVSLYVASTGNVVIEGSIQSLQGSANEHPLVVYSEKSIRISGGSSAIRVQACLISSGSPSLQFQPGESPPPQAVKDAWIAEMQGSAFTVEPEKRAELIHALNASEKIVWLRGSIGIKHSFVSSPGVTQLHFEACPQIHDVIPSFRFVQILEGRQKWL